ncbi:MAG: class II aldolase/adducin family protein [bacterium]
MRPAMTLEDAAEGILHVGRRMYQRGFVAANDGNISVRLAADRLLVTPTGVSKGFMTKTDLVVTDGKGAKLSGRREVTSEIRMHTRAYELRADIGAVVHAHPPYATAFAVAGIPLAECVLPEVVLTIGSVPLAEYGTPSTDEVAESVARVVIGSDAFLLRNHGVMCVGPDVLTAYHRVETVEHLAEISFIARHLGRLSPLAHEQVMKLLAVRERLGVKGPYPGCSECGACAPAEESDRAEIVKVIAEEVVRILREGKHAME